MRKIIAVAALLIMTLQAAQAETIKVTVNGMVCAFCVSGIEKTFKAQEAVDQVKVDLDSKVVTINTKNDRTLDDKTVEKLILDSGFTVTNITRDKK